MNIEELVKVGNTMLDDTNDSIIFQLNSASSWPTNHVAAGQMEDAIGRDVTANEAEETAELALQFIEDYFDGDAKAGMAFLADAYERSPAIGQMEIKTLVESGAAKQMVELSKSDPETYGQMLQDLNSDPQLLAAAQQDPKAAIDNYLATINQELDPSTSQQPPVIVAGDPTTSPPASTEPPEPPPEPEEDKRTYLVGLSRDQASDVLGGFFGGNTEDTVSSMLSQAVGIGSMILNNGGGNWFINFCKDTLGCEIDGVQLTEEGLKVTMADTASPDVLESLQEMKIITPSS